MDTAGRESDLRADAERLLEVIDVIRNARNIIVCTGAGISVSCGIPDFRSKDIGIYNTMDVTKFGDLPSPELLFDAEYFKMDPLPFFRYLPLMLRPGPKASKAAAAASSSNGASSSSAAGRAMDSGAEDVGEFVPSDCHRFIEWLARPVGPGTARALGNSAAGTGVAASVTESKGGVDEPAAPARAREDGGRLLRNYTLNIDGLEAAAFAAADAVARASSAGSDGRCSSGDSSAPNSSAGGSVRGAERVIQCHGNLVEFRCVKCRAVRSLFRDIIPASGRCHNRLGDVFYCREPKASSAKAKQKGACGEGAQAVQEAVAAPTAVPPRPRLARAASSDSVYGSDAAGSERGVSLAGCCGGVMRPGLVMFGDKYRRVGTTAAPSSMSSASSSSLAGIMAADLRVVDCVLVVGTSLTVRSCVFDILKAAHQHNCRLRRKATKAAGVRGKGRGAAPSSRAGAVRSSDSRGHIPILYINRQPPSAVVQGQLRAYVGGESAAASAVEEPIVEQGSRKVEQAETARGAKRKLGGLGAKPSTGKRSGTSAAPAVAAAPLVAVAAEDSAPSCPIARNVVDLVADPPSVSASAAQQATTVGGEDSCLFDHVVLGDADRVVAAIRHILDADTGST